MPEGLVYSTRREFLRGTFGTLSVSATMPGFLARTAEAMFDDHKGNDKILVILQLSGGNDGLNTVVPFAADSYHRARPTIAIPRNDCLKLNDQLGLHPSLTGLKELFDDGKLAIIQGVGYPNPNRSHFKSMDIWHTADPTDREHSGWLGRYFDACCKGQEPPPANSAVALMSESPLALSGDAFSALAFESPDELRWKSGRATRDARRVFELLNSTPPGSAWQSRKQNRQGNEALDYLRRAALEARKGAADVRSAVSVRHTPGTGAGGRLRQHLALVTEMIAADFPTSVYYVSHGGFDTHAGQTGRHSRLLAQFSDATKWFVDTLKKHGLLDRVLLMTFSEFGRRVYENASAGTDHGTAAPMFVVGSKINPGIHFEHPSFETLDNGDLIHRCDFRRVYAAVLRKWLAADDKKILRGAFTAIKLLADSR